MQRVPLGSSGIEVSRLCLGAMNFGWTADESASFAVLDAFVEAGGNFIDTANIYSAWAPGNRGGESEEILGRWIHTRGNRDSLVIATKVRARMWPGANGEGLGRAHITRAVEDSLRRLQLYTIDLYQAHSPDAAVPIEETLAVFADLITAGKVRSIGLSNYTAAELTAALDAARTLGVPVVSLQPHYNLVHRAEFESSLQQACLEAGVAVLPYSPLAAGFLSGKYAKGDPMRARVKKYATRRGWGALSAVQDVATARGVPPAVVSLAWLMAQPAVTAPIVGANTPAQLGEPLTALDFNLTPEEFATLSIASMPPPTAAKP
ncbi:MAG TPA: aldo/keto reductase [Tepidiformaceae bacterium]|nr:aldo/keto reductase [Tepidiformaceae bacterium]